MTYRITVDEWRELERTSLDIRIPVSALYRNAGVPEGVDELEGEV